MESIRGLVGEDGGIDLGNYDMTSGISIFIAGNMKHIYCWLYDIHSRHDALNTKGDKDRIYYILIFIISISIHFDIES